MFHKRIYLVIIAQVLDIRSSAQYNNEGFGYQNADFLIYDSLKRER